MSIHKLTKNQGGFTLFEMLITISLLTIIVAVFYGSFNTLVFQYFRLQKAGTQATTLATSTQRIANVLRGTTDFISVANNEVTVYAYFFPSNSYVSQIRYYLSADQKMLLADVTPMTANPPSGTPLTANKKTYTIMESYYKASGVNLFTYLDASGNTLSTPISDQHVIKGIKIVLAVPKTDAAAPGNQTVSMNISLRNRKTNL